MRSVLKIKFSEIASSVNKTKMVLKYRQLKVRWLTVSLNKYSPPTPRDLEKFENTTCMWAVKGTQIGFTRNHNVAGVPL